jgi:hypothetical protein
MKIIDNTIYYILLFLAMIGFIGLVVGSYLMLELVFMR